MTAHIIERWHTGSASWPASVVSPAREGSYCNSRPTTTVEPIISSVERGNAFSPEPARGLQGRGGISPLLAPQRKDSVPAELADYDCVLSTQVLEHVLSPTAYLAEAYRVLRPGGHLLLSTHGLFEDHFCPYDYWRWTVYGLRKLVEETGFKIDRILKLTTGPRAAMFLAERELFTWGFKDPARLRFKGPGSILSSILTLFQFSLSSRGREHFYTHMLHYAMRVVQFMDAKRRHDACDASFPRYRMADPGEPGHDMYIAVAVLAHR